MPAPEIMLPCRRVVSELFLLTHSKSSRVKEELVTGFKAC